MCLSGHSATRPSLKETGGLQEAVQALFRPLGLMDVKTPKDYPGSVEAALHSSPRAMDDKSRAQVIKDYKLAVEYKWLKKQAPGGVYVMPSPRDLRLWHGVIFVRKAMYSNGIFKFRIELPAEYNDVGVYPRVFFVTPVFSPLVHPQTGELDLRSSFPEWNPDKHYLITVLTFLKKIFYMKDFPPLPAPPNPQAHALVASDKAEFLRRVEECVAASQENVYVPDDGSLIRFTEAKPEHQQLSKAIKDAYESSLSSSTSTSGSSSSANHDESRCRLNIMQVLRSVVQATRPHKGPS